MGAYLSEPVTDKDTESASLGNMKYGATSMQGWRINQEDAHNCILNFDENCSFFAVYDGHGGAEVAQYAARRFPEFLKSTGAWSEGRLGQALEDAFLSFDDLLTHEDVLEELKTLAGTKKKENEGDEPDEDKTLLLQEAGLPLDEVLRKYGLRIDRNFLVSSGERTVISSKIKIKREKRAPVATALAEDNEEGPPTPPSSPDARSAAAAAASTAQQSGTGEKCDSSTRQENADTLPMSPPTVEGDSSTQSKRARSTLKRKSHQASHIHEANEHVVVSSGESGVKKNHDSSQANGNGEADNMKTGGDEVVSSVDELPNVKRFKDDGTDSNKYEKMMADSTTILDNSNDATPAVAGDEQPLNGSHSEHSMAGNGTGVDSTSEDFKKKKATKTVDENAPISGGNSGDVGSPMMVEEPSSGGKANEEKVENNRSAGDNRGCAMDESSGASEDDEDEDYNMEVEDEESSEDSSETNGIEEDEVVDENDEMGMDEEDEEEEEPEDDDMFAMPSGDTPGVDSGTTACVAVIKGSTIYVANAGDSRCVLCRGDTAVDLSLDHKPEDLTEKRRIELAGGRITTDGRVNGGLNLSRAIGDHFYKRNSELPLRDQMITALPDVRVEQLKPEDRFLVLACDGIWNSMSSQDVVDFVRTRLAKGLSPEAVCEQLCDVCLAPNTIGDGTGCDNMTAIVVLLNQNSSSSNPAKAASNNEEHAAEGSEAEARCT